MSEEPGRKKMKTYKVKYSADWEKSYPIGKVNGYKHAFYCFPCKKSVSCAHQGLRDVKDHCLGLIHKRNEAAVENNVCCRINNRQLIPI